ncbi:amidase [Mycolicibacterium baixiangningiae]|uniref:amidase n=1 Tax=Mycolicibacterium baixiangningiae TaxID=2761578 RepID=UPI0018D15B34|nr:amidase [Mycolicibacterium baixiangningiae]
MTTQDHAAATAPTSSQDLAYLSAVDALAMFRSKELSPVELMTALVERADALEPTINAFTEEFFEQALQQAKFAADAYARDGSAARPLEGIAVAIKDEVSIEGLLQTEGSLVHAGEYATATHPLAQRIFDAGGIMHARTTTPEFCCVPFTHSRMWGVTPSPWDLSKSAGGSSGGSGAALAAGTTTLATGSDIGGSIRIPAAFCGVVGLKPSYGRVPDVTPWNLDHYCQNGPMARTVADTALLFDVMQGPHSDDIATLSPGLSVPATLPDVSGWRVAMCVALGDYDVEKGVVENLRGTADLLRELGVIVDEVELPWTREQIMEILFAHFGYIAGASAASLSRGKPELLNDYVVEYIARSTSRAATMTMAETFDAETEFYRPLSQIFGDYRVLMCPTLATVSLEAGDSYIGHGPTINGRATGDVDRDGLMTGPFNIVGRCPSTALPSGFDVSGMPTSVQFVGRPYQDIDSLAVAAAVDRATPLYRSAAARPTL